MENYRLKKPATEWLVSTKYRFNRNEYRISLTKVIPRYGLRDREELRHINDLLFLEDQGYGALRNRGSAAQRRPDNVPLHRYDPNFEENHAGNEGPPINQLYGPAAEKDNVSLDASQSTGLRTEGSELPFDFGDQIAAGATPQSRSSGSVGRFSHLSDTYEPAAPPEGVTLANVFEDNTRMSPTTQQITKAGSTSL